MDNKKEILKKEILELTKAYYQEVHALRDDFVSGETFINYGGRFFDAQEMVNLVDSSLDFWLTGGKWATQFEQMLSSFLGVKYCSLVNSGSSANLLAFMSLTSPLLGNRQLVRGDEVITVACGFPTTVSPIIQFGAVPVFVDICVPQYNIDVSCLESALSDKTKAVMIAHTLGNPFDLRGVRSFCDKHNLWLIEDNCDALGSMYFMDDKWHYTGTLSDLGTSSFYPPHHITMGEGGAVYTQNAVLHKIVNSLRDWGRDCWCIGGTDNTCHSRFQKQYGQLPKGYDHKYVYSHFGYNLKATDMQAAIGVAQLDKLEGIIKSRRSNFDYLYNRLKGLPYLILPEQEPHSKPSWFGFAISITPDAPFSRNQLSEHLEGKRIQTRNLFAGNLLKHPLFDSMRDNHIGYRTIGNLINTDFVMNNTFWIGVYPGMTPEMLAYMADTIENFVLPYKNHTI